MGSGRASGPHTVEHVLFRVIRTRGGNPRGNKAERLVKDGIDGRSRVQVFKLEWVWMR